MKTVIVPIDFSETSLNAARYAAQMLKEQPDTRIILYHMFEDKEEADNAGEYLESLKQELEAKGDRHIEVVKEMGEDLIDCLERLAYQKTATLIVMGITGKSPLQQILIGSNTLKITDKNICPVMIVPPDATFREIRNIVLTSDFKNVEASTPTRFIKTVLEYFKPQLHIVNVNSEHYVALTEEVQQERTRMQDMFAEFSPEFYFIGMNDFHEAIEQFVTDKNIDLIITIPRYRTGIGQFFRTSHTKRLVYHSSVPVLAAHELM
ncbi:MAG TPA: universal stress protein [Chitinophagaceae bacterium]|nr:universal stress protein [Chitinophagaceae bacterium]